MKTKVIISCIIMCLLILIGVQVNAALDVSTSASCKETIEPGGTITLDLNLNVTSANQGVQAVIATVDYPSEVMEMSIGTISGIDIIPSENLLTIAPDEAITSGSKTIAKLNFKVNENTTATGATIKISEITAIDEDGTEKELADITKTVKIQETEEPEPDPKPEKTLTSIKITNPKTTIEFGKNYDMSEIKVIATYSDGTTEDVSSKCTHYFDGKEITSSSTAYLEKGPHTIKAMYEGKEDSFTLTVTDSDAKESGKGTETGTGTGTGGDKTTSPSNIAKTGLEIITIPGIIVSIVIAVVAFKRYNKMF